MKRSYMCGLVALIYGAVFFGFLGLSWEELPNWGEPAKSFAMWGFFLFLIPMGFAAYYSHKEGDKFRWDLS